MEETFEIDRKTLDWFAGCALQGMLANTTFKGNPDEYANDSLAYAVAMVKALLKMSGAPVCGHSMRGSCEVCK